MNPPWKSSWLSWLLQDRLFSTRGHHKHLTSIRMMVAVPVLTILGGVGNIVAPGLFRFCSWAVLVAILIGAVLFGGSERDKRDLFVLDSGWDLIPSAATALAVSFLFLILPPVNRYPSDISSSLILSIPGIAVPLLILISNVVVFLVVQRTARSLQSRRYLTIALVLVLLPLAMLALGIQSSPSFARVIWNLSGVYLLYFPITLIALLATFLPFAMFMSLKESKIDDLNNQALFMLGFPAGISAGDLAAIVQGFTGLRVHYQYFHYIAVTGVGLAVVSILLMLAFWALTLRRPLKKGSVAHYVIALGFALAAGCTVMYGVAEGAGMLYQTLTGVPQAE